MAQKQMTGEQKIELLVNVELAKMTMFAIHPVNEINPNLIKTEKVNTLTQLNALLNRKDVQFVDRTGTGRLQTDTPMSKEEVKMTKDDLIEKAASKANAPVAAPAMSDADLQARIAANESRQRAERQAKEAAEQAKQNAENQRTEKLTTQWTDQIGKLMRSGKLDLDFGVLGNEAATEKKAVLPSATQDLLNLCIRKNGDAAFNPALLQSAINEANQLPLIHDYGAKWTLAK